MLTATPPAYRDADSAWWSRSGPAPDYPALAEDRRCDYVIVGAGWTGLSAAHRLAKLEPDARIVLLDAGRLGAGAAGRNSGFLFDVPFVFAPDAYRGREDAGRLEIRLYRSAIDALRRVVDTTALGPDWLEIGQYHGAVGAPGLRELEIIEAGLTALGEPFRRLDADAAAEELGTGFYGAAIHTPGTVQINPLRVLRAYAAALPPNVSIHEDTPVVAIEPGEAPVVRATGGSIKARRVLLTTNAFLRQVSGVSAPLIPVATYAAMTEPLGAGASSNQTWGVVPTALFGTSLRKLPDGRLLIRNSYRPSFDIKLSPRTKAVAAGRHRLALERRFPEQGAASIEAEWSGIVSFFRGASGLLSELAPGVHAGVTSGMPVCLVYGAALADQAAARDGEDLDFVRGRSVKAPLPPMPILRPAAAMLAAWKQFKERGEL